MKEQAADLGDRVHTAAEARVLGAPVADDPIVNPYVDQLDAWLESWGVDLNEHIEATEITCLHRRLGYAGTADLMVWLPTGPGHRLELWLIDYKSSATRPARSVYPENTLQLAALRYCETVLLPDDTEQPMPRIERTGVLNLRAGSHALVPMPPTGPRTARSAAPWRPPAGCTPPLHLPRAVRPRARARAAATRHDPKGRLTMGSRLRNIQARAAEHGRLRTGYTQGNRPMRSSTWVITSHSEEHVRTAAKLWGGEPEQWSPLNSTISSGGSSRTRRRSRR